MQQSTTSYYLFNSITKKVGNINITLRNSLLKIIGKRFDKKKALFNCFDKSEIQNCSNA